MIPMAEIQIYPVAPAQHAAGILALITSVFEEPDLWIMTEAGEVEYTTEEEVEYLQVLVDHATSGGWVALEADGGAVVGFLAARGGERRRTRHSVNVGLSVRKDHRNLGVGRRLIEAVLGWARAHEEVSRVELAVIADNTPGVHLYRSLGFEVEGVKRGSYRKDGSLYDEYLMALLLDAG